MDLILRNVNIMNGETGVFTPASIGIKNGVIADIKQTGETEALLADTHAYSRNTDTEIPYGKDLPEEHGMMEIDLGGAYLLPGLIDFHTHLFTAGSSFGINADLLLASGTAMAVDMGTSGASGYETFHRLDVEPRTMKIKSFINLSPLGQPGSGIYEPLRRSVIPESRIEELAGKYADEICGIKVRCSKEIVGEEGIRPLEHAIELGERLGLPVCVHTTNPPVRAGEIVKRLRPGDIYSHMYHSKGMTILEENGSVQREFFEAQERGVYLEVGHGKMNFDYNVAERAVSEGLFPDIISSDATPRTFANTGEMRDLPYVMSKLWNLGMALPDVIRAATETPAGILRCADRSGTIQVGRTADLTVLREKREAVEFSDSSGNKRRGDRRLAPEMTILNGKIVYFQGEGKIL